MFPLYLLCSLQTSAHCRSLPQSSDGNPNFRSQNFELHKKLIAEKISAPSAILPTRFRNGSYTLLLFPKRSRSFPLFSAEWTIIQGPVTLPFRIFSGLDTGRIWQFRYVPVVSAMLPTDIRTIPLITAVILCGSDRHTRYFLDYPA